MNDYTIKAKFETGVTPREIMAWLRSTDGIAGWWSDRVSGAAASKGDEFNVEFPTTDAVVGLVVAEAGDNVVEWHVPESPPWWKDTSIRFEVEAQEDGSTLSFTHRGFDPEDPIIPVITPAWVGFLNNLVQVARTGQPSPAVVN
jgi:hypothetical protein